MGVSTRRIERAIDEGQNAVLEWDNYALGTALKGKNVTISGVAGKRAAAGSRAKLHELLQL